MFGFLMRRGFGAALTFILLVLFCTGPSFAGNPSAFISGTVMQNGKPIADAVVTASGNNRTLRTKTDVGGQFRFPPLTLGSYLLSAAYGKSAGEMHVDLTIGGAAITITLGSLKQIAEVAVRSASTIHGSGGDVVLNSTALTEMPYNNSFSEMMIQLPGAARGANGVVHMNGDHGVIDYQLDGVMLPEELNRDIGGEINLNDVSYISLIEGAYPAQYGLKFGSVFNISTRAGTGPAGVDGNVSYGSYATVNSTIGFHSPLAGGGGYDVAFSPRAATTTRM